MFKSRPAERARLLAARHPRLSAEHRVLVVDSDDALDAGLSALAMWEALGALRSLARTGDPTERMEGRIWHPPGSAPSRKRGAERPLQNVS